MAIDLALDIGTSRTRLATRRGALVDTATVVAIDTSNGSVVAIGDDAPSLVGRTSRHVTVYRPFSQGTTVDFDVTARLIAAFFARAGISRTSRARVVMSVPTLATPIERRALVQAAVQAGAKDVALVEAPIAAAIGIGLPLADPVGSALAIIGAGASEVAVLSLGGIVNGKARRVGGSHIDESLAASLRNELGVVVAPDVIESVKRLLGSAMGRDDGRVEPVVGRTVIRGESVVVSVGADPVHRAIAESLQQVTRMIQECFTETQPDLAFDVAARGMTLAGGGAYINDVVDLLENVLGVTVRVAPEADRAVINGLRICMEEMSTLHPMLRAST